MPKIDLDVEKKRARFLLDLAHETLVAKYGSSYTPPVETVVAFAQAIATLEISSAPALRSAQWGRE